MAVPVPRNSNANSAGRTSRPVDGMQLRLEYPGKKSSADILATAGGQYQPSVQYQGGVNRLYHDDNLSVLAHLAQDNGVRGKVKLIYIDPPYATNGAFESRKQTFAYSDLLVGATFVEALRERLILLHHLLTDDGSLYLHLDERMVFHMRVILDEVFGVKNFRNCITRKKCNPKNYTRKTFGNVADYILFYTKSDEYVWNRPFEQWDEDRAKKEYVYVDEQGRRFKKVPVHAPGVRNGQSGQLWKGKAPPPGKHWQYLPSTLDEMDARGEIYWSPTGNPRRKIYLDSSAGVPLQDIWLDMRDAHNQNIHVTGYPTEKNPALLARIIEASSNPGDLVLDCYCGSGTTLAVASQLGRRWIGADSGAEAIKTTLHRLGFGTEPMGDFVNEKKQSQLPLHDPIADFTLFEPQSDSTSTSTGKGEAAARRELMELHGDSVEIDV
jgi:adenine-specific DNA-methyltransferase